MNVLIYTDKHHSELRHVNEKYEEQKEKKSYNQVVDKVVSLRYVTEL